MTVKNFLLLGTALIGFALNSVVNAADIPNYYECSGRNAHLTLTIGSNSGNVGIMPVETKLDLQLNNMSYSFTADEITTESTLIGELWEVMVEQIPDLYIKDATVIIPTIALEQGPVNFRTKLLLTKTNTPFSPDTLEGVVNPSRYVNLRCRASMLYF
ncbi:MAG: hypothetical protein P8163_15635 [Candidatus Thiodiazotropha sp.]